MKCQRYRFESSKQSLAFLVDLPYTPIDMTFLHPHIHASLSEAVPAVSASPCRYGFDRKQLTGNAHVLTGRHAR
jgi:hypothetical protein